MVHASPTSHSDPLTAREPITPVLRSGHDGAHTHRIPALVSTGDKLICFAEARREGSGDAGRIDLVATTSTDGWAWSRPVVICAGTDQTHGNPAPVVSAAGDIVLLTTSNPAVIDEAAIISGQVGAGATRRVHAHRIDPATLQVTGSTDLTTAVKPDSWGWYATGPGHGLRLPSGRLVVGANHSTLDGAPAGSVYGSHTLVSDDDGRSWRIGLVDDGDAELDPAVHCSGPNESMVAAWAGGLVFSSRNEHPSDLSTRGFTRSADAMSARPLRGVPLLPVPRVQAGLLTISIDGTQVLLLSSPSQRDERRDLALFASLDAGLTWSEPLLVGPGPAAYSDLAWHRGRVHLVWERGRAWPHDEIAHLELRPEQLISQLVG